MGQVAGAREKGGGRKVASVGGEPGGAEERGDARDPAEINQGILRSFLPLRSRLNGVGGGEGASFSAECITGRRAAIKLSRAIPRVSACFTSRDRRRRRSAADARGEGGYPRGSPRSLASRFGIDHGTRIPQPLRARRRSRGSVRARRGQKTGEERGRGAARATSRRPDANARARRARSCAAQHAGIINECISIRQFFHVAPGNARAAGGRASYIARSIKMSPAWQLPRSRRRYVPFPSERVEQTLA